MRVKKEAFRWIEGDIECVELEVSGRERYYWEEGLERLMREITKKEPGAIMFCDRSARPVSWFLRAGWKTLQEEGIQKQRLPSVRFVSYSPLMHSAENLKNLDGFHEDIRGERILLVDECTMKRTGGRQVDKCAQLLRDLGFSKIDPYVFFEPGHLGSVWSISPYNKALLYRIEDSQEGSLISRELDISNMDRAIREEVHGLRVRFRKIFSDLGEEIGREILDLRGSFM